MATVDPWIGRRLGPKDPARYPEGRYVVVEGLGEGGWAVVYRGHDDHLDRDVALKIPKGELFGDDEEKQRAFLREIRKLVKAKHPNVVPVFDAVESADGRPVAVLDLMEAGSLAKRLDDAPGRKQSLEEVVGWLAPIAAAIDHLHEVVGIVHADVKPQNILFDAAGTPRISDFGIVVSLKPGTSSRLPTSNSMSGTVTYMAPELLLSRSSPSPASDRYALAMTVYEALSGRFPYDVSQAGGPLVFLGQWMRAIEKADPIPLFQFAPEVGEAVSDLVMKGLDRDPAHRFSSCAAFSDALRMAYRELVEPKPEPPHSPPPPPLPPPPPPPRSLPWMAIAVGGALVVGATALIAPRIFSPSTTTPTVLVIEEPASGTLVSTATVRVAGRAIGPAGHRLLVDEAPVEVRDGRFDATVPAGPDGSRPVVVRYGAADGPGAAVERRTIEVDRTPPTVDVTMPSNRSFPFVVASVDFEGKVVDAHPAKVRVGTQTVETRPDGSFQVFGIRLTGEPDTIVEVEGFDRGGLASPIAKVVLHRDAKEADPWVSPLAAAVAAAAGGDWPEAKSRYVEAKAKRMPASEAKADIEIGIRALDAVVEAEALAKVEKWDEAEAKVASVRPLPRGLTLPSLLATGLGSATITDLTPPDGSPIDGAEILVRGTVRGRRGDQVECLGSRFKLDRAGGFAIRVTMRASALEANEPIELRVVTASGTPRSDPYRVTYTRPWTPAALAFLAGWAKPSGADKDAATGYPSRIVRTKDGMEMALVPAGTFQMGAIPGDKTTSDDDKPRHPVRLTHAYYMDVTPVTNEQFTRFVEDSKYVTTAEVKKRGANWRSAHFGVAPDPQFPVCEVSWFDAEAYEAWIGKPVRLPTEAEFERVLRGGAEGTLYPWGEAWPPPEGWGVKDGESTRRVVTAFEPKHYGLRDLAGNVKTWCSIGFVSGSRAFQLPASTDEVSVDPTNGGSSLEVVVRALRGASWYWSPKTYRCSNRGLVEPEYSSFHSGFRLVAPVLRPVADLVHDLESDAPDQRASAIADLARSGTRDPAAIRALVLAQADFGLGRAAFDALEELSPPATVAVRVMIPARYEELPGAIDQPARLEWVDFSQQCAYGPTSQGERQGETWALTSVPPVLRAGGTRLEQRDPPARVWRLADAAEPPARAGPFADDGGRDGPVAPPAPVGHHAGPVPVMRAGEMSTEFWIPGRELEPGRWIWRRTLVCLPPQAGGHSALMVPNVSIRLDEPMIEGKGDSAVVRFRATVTGQKGPAATALRVTFKFPGATDLAVSSGTKATTMSTKAEVATSTAFALAEGQSIEFSGTAKIGGPGSPESAVLTLEVFDGETPIAQATQAAKR